MFYKIKILVLQIQNLVAKKSKSKSNIWFLQNSNNGFYKIQHQHIVICGQKVQFLTLLVV